MAKKAKKKKTPEVPLPKFSEAELQYMHRRINIGNYRVGDGDVDLSVAMKLEAYVAAVRKKRNEIELKATGQTDGEEEEGRASERVSEPSV